MLLAIVTSTSFKGYQKKFSKHYSSEEEKQYRKSIYRENLKKINSINSNPRYTWKAAVNMFADRLPHEMKQYMSYNRDINFNTFTHSSVQIPQFFLQNLPDKLDWREKGVVQKPKDQSACGSCWAFSASAVLESHIAIQTGKLFDFSEQQLVSCTPNPDQCGGTGGCSGSTQWLAFDYVKTAGITTTANWPYHARDDKCDVSKIKKVATIDGYVRLPTNDYNALLTAVATVGPIAISVAASDWQFYDSGVFNTDCGTEINHAVTVVGYGTDSAEGDYWIVRNSWSAGWGEGGHIRIMKEKSSADVQCGIDYNPASGSGCKGGPDQIEVCGLCGMYSDSSYPTGGKLA